MVESAIAMAVLGLFGFFLSIVGLRRVNDLDQRLRRLERENASSRRE